MALWLEMGLGKTVITLTAIDRLINDAFAVRRVLIIAPAKVAEATWQDEAAKWPHLQNLRISTITGTSKQREAALAADADIYIMGRDNTAWLVQRCGREWPFDMLVLDEATSFKSHDSQRFKALKRVRPRVHRVVELTGTPAPNNYLDLWAQIYLLDQGEALGKYITHYRQDYFTPDKQSREGRVFSWRPRPGATDAIEAAIAHEVISIKAADHLQLPGRIIEDIPVVLDTDSAIAYRRMEEKCLLEVDGATITAQQAATLTGKLLQLCNGSIYDEHHTAHSLHRCKLDAFNEAIDALDGQAALVFYGFQFDAEQLTAEIKTRHKGLRARVLTSHEDADAWNRGEIDLLLAHPASCAYGLNLQAGGHHLIWYSLPWSLELYEQGNARLYRQGQQQPVIIHRLLVKGGADEMVAKALTHKDRGQEALMQALKTRIGKAREEQQHE